MERANMEAALDKMKAERDHLRLNSWAQIEKAKDIERKNINQELHDGLGHDLASAQSWISMMKKETLTPAEFRVIDNLSNTISNLSRKIRQITKGESADRVEELGLQRAAEEFLLRKDGVANISFHFQTLGEPRTLSFERELAVFRLIQEISANAIKHAKCGHVWIRIFWEESRLILEAEDDGVTDGSKVTSKSIRKRVDQLSVQLINLDPFKGLHIQIIFEGW